MKPFAARRLPDSSLSLTIVPHEGSHFPEKGFPASIPFSYFSERALKTFPSFAQKIS